MKIITLKLKFFTSIGYKIKLISESERDPRVYGRSVREKLAGFTEKVVDDGSLKLKEFQMIDKKYCLHCGSLLGLDCGDAEPDYNEHFCSEGCYKMEIKESK